MTKETISLQEKRLERMRSCSASYTITLLGKEIIVLPNVFYPATDTKLLIETTRINPDESVLELCAGTGAISLFLAEGARRILATDINQHAIDNINANIKKHYLTGKMEAMIANVFPETNEKFDVLVINPPYTDKEAKDVVEMSVWDKDNIVIKKVLSGARKYLIPIGRIYVSWANFADFYFFENLVRKENYKIQRIAETTKENHTYRVYELTPLLP